MKNFMTSCQLIYAQCYNNLELKKTTYTPIKIDFDLKSKYKL